MIATEKKKKKMYIPREAKQGLMGHKVAAIQHRTGSELCWGLSKTSNVC